MYNKYFDKYSNMNIKLEPWQICWSVHRCETISSGLNLVKIVTMLTSVLQERAIQDARTPVKEA